MTTTQPGADGRAGGERSGRHRPRVVVVGAGFGGLALARELDRDGRRGEPLDVVLVDQHNYHLFQPLLYQVATAGLEPADVAQAVRGVVRRCRRVTFRHGQVAGVDFEARRVQLSDGASLPYDELVIGAGTVTATFGVEGVDEHAFGLKTIADAVALRSHLLAQFEQCDRNPELIDEGLLTVVVVGAGPTGVEVAGAMAELIARVLAKDFPGLPVHRARVVIVEMIDTVLAPFAPRLQRHAAAQLTRRGVELRLGTSVAEVTPTEVRLDDGTAIPTRTVLWTAGVRASPLADVLGLDQDKGGRIRVERDLSVPGHPGVWAIGDIAAAKDEDGRVLPQLAPVAQQEGRHVARQIGRLRAGLGTEAFRYVDKGTMATIGRRAAVAQLPFGLHFRGTVAWVFWLVLHIVTLIGFRNRVSVLINWAWNYLTWDPAGRLITEPQAATLPGHRGAEHMSSRPDTEGSGTRPGW